MVGKLPLQIWCGDRDVFCPAEQSLEMYRWVKNAELANFPGADHFSIALKADLIALGSLHEVCY